MPPRKIHASASGSRSAASLPATCASTNAVGHEVVHVSHVPAQVPRDLGVLARLGQSLDPEVRWQDVHRLTEAKRHLGGNRQRFALLQLLGEHLPQRRHASSRQAK